MIEAGIAVLVFFLMFIIGASIDRSDLEKIKIEKNKVLLLTLAQALFLPITAFLFIELLQPSTTVAAGMLLIALCPGGAVSNIYSFIAKGNLAFSVTLTALYGSISVILLPLSILTIFPFIVSVDLDVSGLIKKQSLQLIFSLVVPVIIGMYFRYAEPHKLMSIMPTLEKVGGLGLLILLISIFIQHNDKIQQQLSSLIYLALLFTFAAIGIAYVLSKVLRLSTREQVVVLIEFPVRNLALAALISVNIFQNVDYLLFAAVFFVIQTPIILGITLWHRSKLS
jgi:BASS family bile acid:Na+ symporter